MPKRFYTCIIVPDASQRLHKLRIPVQVLYVLAAIGVLSFFVAVALGFNYAHMAFRAADYDQLQSENTHLKIETKNLEVSATKLSSKINDLENLSEKITKVIESDKLFRGPGKLNVKTAGGSKEDLSTAAVLSGSLKTDVDAMRGRTSELEGQLKLLELLANQRATMIRYTPNIWPISGRIGSVFGARLDPFTGDQEMHVGLDIVAPFGSPIKAPADGIVIFAERKSDYGNLVILDHGNGLTTRDGHLSRFNVHAGQKVRKGDVIGYVGMTGRTTAPHLHYEVRLNDHPVNPRNYLPRAE